MIEKKLFSTSPEPEKAILVSLTYGKQNPVQTLEHLEELKSLCETAGVITLRSFHQKLEKKDHRTYVGKGKFEEIAAFVKDQEPDMIVFDDDLTPAQSRNIEEELKIKVLDRSLLILEIFSMRAKTQQAKTQVELAQYQYLYPRLTRMWTHLSKQKGGVGMRGPGEKELETDRRIVNDRISFLKEKLEEIDKQSITRRKNREKIVRVALVGYTNVGKSTIMNLLSKSDVFAENKLFATVDSTVRKVVWQQIPFLLTDTVGFIRKLPTHLIESFKSTLDEVKEADVLIHVVDVSHPSYFEHVEVVEKTLEGLGCAQKPTLLVYNKIDALSEEAQDLADWEIVSPASQKNMGFVSISAQNNLNIETLRQEMLKLVKKVHVTIFPNYIEPEIY